MATQLALAAMAQMYDPQLPEVSINHSNKDVAHWFDANIDGQDVFVRMTRGEKAPVSTTHRVRMERVVQRHADALRELLGTSDAPNNMLSIVGSGEYRRAEFGNRDHRDFTVTYGGKDLLDAEEPVRSFVASIRHVIETDDLA